MCEYCEELNTESEMISTDEILLNLSGHFYYSMPIIYCPNCGEMLDKYKDNKDMIEVARKAV